MERRSRLGMGLLVLLIALIGLTEAQDENFRINAVDTDSASLPAEHRSSGDFGPQLGNTGFVSAPQVSPNDPWPLKQPDMPQIKNLQVQCEKSFMRVAVEFDRPFYGVIFSKGYYSDTSCVHVQSASGSLQAQFDIYLNSCGMTSSSNAGNVGQPTPSGTFIENVVIIQYDPLVQEVWDAARKLRCTWFDYYEKSVTFRPFQVDMLNAVTANFLGDNLQCWMQIQVGKGPWASEVSGIVKIGQTMTMVLAIKDDENKFDMMVRNCVAHDGKRAPIQLVDERGCITRPKIMGSFQKVKDFGSSASVVSYAYFQAFKFPDSMNVHFQCVIQVCRYNCPEPECGGGGGSVGQSVPQAPAIGYTAAGSETAYQRVRPSSQKPTQKLDPRTPVRNNIKAKNLVSSKSDRLEIPGPLPVPFPVHVRSGELSVPSYPDLNAPSYPNIKRVGTLKDSAGRPRSLDLNEVEDNNDSRRRRSVETHVYRRSAQEMTDVSTTRVIQVVAPGDVAFNLNSANETVIVTDINDGTSNICMSTTGFAAGLIMLLLVLTIACLVACFLYTRVRAFNSKGSVSTFTPSYETPEFVKVPGPK